MSTVVDVRALLTTCDADSATGAWIVRAGAWPVATEAPEEPPPSATGRGIVALGAARAHPADADRDADVETWDRALEATGGDFGDELFALPVWSVYVDAVSRARLVRALDRGLGLDEAVAEAARGARVVRYAPLDVFVDRAVRVAEVVTSLHRGGAEQVVADLAEELPRRGMRACVTTLGSPLRGALSTPEPPLELARARIGHTERLDHLGRALVGWGADVAHVHLLDATDVARLAASGIPVVVTVHNARQGWPSDLPSLGASVATLFVACSRAVERDVRAAGLGPVRTVHNGIDASRFAPRSESNVARRLWRERLGIDERDLVLLAIANLRPQKRLERLPAVVRALEATRASSGDDRRVVLVVAGSASAAIPASMEAAERLAAAAREHDVSDRVRMAGEVEDVAGLLAAADVLVSSSAWEGLSLAHLEARAAGLPVVATDAGGTSEIAERDPGVTVVPLDADATTFAKAVRDATARGRTSPSAWFTRGVMADGYARLLVRAAASPKAPKSGLVLVTNNFSTGGAQSSARRLLGALAAAGAPVSAITIEEDPEHPTPGRRALVEAGIAVASIPPPSRCPTPLAVLRALDEIAARSPAVVVFWNAIAEHKVLLAEALFDVPVFDVSPGETYFASLERFFSGLSPGIPHASPRDYGARLAGVVVKYEAEAKRAFEVLGAPVHVVPNGVPLTPLAERRPSTKLVIGTLARIARHKRLEDLLDALRIAAPSLPPHVLRIAGGVERDAHEYARELERRGEGLAVEWLGDVANTGAFLRDLDVFALVAEPAGCPNASLEAMAHALPVVATDVGAMRDQLLFDADGEKPQEGTVSNGLEPRRAGLLVPPRDPAAMAEALVELARSPELRRALGAAARARVEARFSIDRMASDYARIFGLSLGPPRPFALTEPTWAAPPT